jgi:hypothetical protein
MKMDNHKISENFQGGAGCKMISPHHFHPTNGVSPANYNSTKPFFRYGRKDEDFPVNFPIQ